MQITNSNQNINLSNRIYVQELYAFGEQYITNTV
jgi:hypothetical protein